MGAKVVGRPVSYTNTLYPSKPFTINLCIPTFSGVMSELIRRMLPKPELIWVNADSKKKLLSEKHVVCQSLIVDDSFLNSFLQCCFKLLFVVKQKQLFISNLLKPWMTLILRVKKNLSLSHIKLSKPYNPLPRRNLISISFSNLNHTKREFLPSIAI